MLPHFGCNGAVQGIRHSIKWAFPHRNCTTGRLFVRRVPRCCASTQGNGVQKEENQFVVTTPLFYANDVPHMGSAYPTIAADVISRYKRLLGINVSFITGTDEHGEKIALAAKKRDLEPLVHCDAMVDLYKQLWSKLNIKYDQFIRTTSKSHELFVSEVLRKVWDSGDIYLDQYEGWYCVDCEEYKDEAGMLGEDHTCSIHRKKCVFRREENYFFRLSKYQKQIEELVIENENFVQPASRRNEVIGWINGGLKDFSISRVNVDWGIRMLQDPRHTVYVWFDALNGYISGLFPSGEMASLEKATELGWPADIHIIGKDILRFHAVYWPAMLMSAGLPVPTKIYGHGFLTKDGMKMGKSVGNVVDPDPLVSTYGSDAVRYFMMKEVSFGQDGDFNEKQFRTVINACLANDIGNLLNRTLNLLKKNCNSTLGVSSSDILHDSPLRAIVSQKVPDVTAGYEQLRFHTALEAVMTISGRGNQFLEETAPWTAFKKGSDGEKAFAGQVLVSVLEAVRIIAVLLSPVTPSLSQRIYLQLGFSEADFENMSWGDVYWGKLQAGHQVNSPQPVFKRIEDDVEFVTESTGSPVPVS